MSSVIWPLRDIAARGAGANLVQARALGVVARYTLQMAFDCCGFLALSFLRGLLVELTTTKLGQYSGLFTGALETTQGGVKIFVLF